MNPPIDPTKTLVVILGNQLFPFAHIKPHRNCRFFMAEDFGLCTYVRHHKQKIALFLAAMRSYRDELIGHGCKLHYEQFPVNGPRSDGRSYEDKLRIHLKGKNIARLVLWEVEDKLFERRLQAFANEQDLELQILTSPMFLTSRRCFESWLGDNRPYMANFYKWQRQRLGLLIDDDGDPVGGQWSYDHDNRRRLPKSQDIPRQPRAKVTDHVGDAIKLVQRHFPEHPGELSEDAWWLPTTRRQALGWLREFLKERFECFGAFEDALSTRGPVLFHSVLTPALNMGLITPHEVLEHAIEFAESNDIPINSLEGFVRQICGWREFVRGIYQHLGEEQERSNFFGHTRKLTSAWYDATTGLLPLDDVIRKAQRFGWAHHIERLMVTGNLMTLCEIAPSDAYRWFMEMFVDSSDWVMVPNVYGMGIFADGGIFATKPYICGSNYIFKMSDYSKQSAELLEGSKPPWWDILDGLYWRFIDRNRTYFKGQARMATAVSTLDRMKKDRRESIFTAAESFLGRATL